MNPLLKRAGRALKIFGMFATMIACFMAITWLLFQIKGKWAFPLILIAMMLTLSWWMAEDEP